LLKKLLERNATLTNADVIALASESVELLFPPGDNWNYSSIGYELLGSLIERISGQSYAQFLEENIFAPLGMDHTYSTPNPERFTDPNLSHSYTRVEGNKVVAYDTDPLDDLVGSGSVYSTVGDMVLYDQALYTDKLVNRAVLAEVSGPAVLDNGQKAPQGFTWTLDSAGFSFFSGSWLAFKAIYARDEKQQFSVIALFNRDYALPKLGETMIQVAQVFDYQNPPTQAASPTPSAAYGTAFELNPCPFEVQPGTNSICGTLTVPEDRSQPAGRTIRLAVAIFKSYSPHPAPDPVIHLIGGPGASALGNTAPILRNGGNQILARRDYILFDQRGVGYSEPNLFCQPYDEYLWNAKEQELSLDEYSDGAFPFLEKCLADWRAQGINVAAYNTVENAADVNDLRLALGYDQVNLYGISYGSLLALTVMRHHPEGVRSVILDAIDPPQANIDLDLAGHVNNALKLLFAACEKGASCANEYGDLKTKFYTTVDRLEANPVVVEVTGPYRSSPYRVVLDGDLFIDTIFGGLFSVKMLYNLPHLIQAAYDERYSELADFIGGMAIGSPGSTGLFFTSWCGEIVFPEMNVVSQPQGIPPQLSDHFSIQPLVDTCRFWNTPAVAASENEPVYSDTPALIFDGLHDPITPPDYAQTVAQTLSNAYYYLFPNMAHGVMRSDGCALEIGLAFLDDPAHEPDTSCMAGLSDISFP
jgi:pimeloyl-ACP methyl ester carboxylesterase